MTAALGDLLRPSVNLAGTADATSFDSLLRDGIELDSLDGLVVIATLEDHLGCPIDADATAVDWTASTWGEVVDAVESLL